MTEGYPKTINEQIDGYIPEIIATFDIKVDNSTVISGEYVTDYMVFMYDGYETRAPLYRLWSTYVQLHAPDFSRAYKAWTQNYDPLSNYDSKETNVYLTDDGSDTTTVTHGKSNTVTANNVKNSYYVTTDESSTPRLENENQQTGSTTDQEGGTTSTTTTHVQTTATIGGGTYSADKIVGELKEKSGNIGVTTSQQMLQSEVELRLNPLVMQYIDTFMREYTYYVSKGEWMY